MENDSQKGGRHRNDTRKNTRLHCSDFSALKNPTTYSNTRSSPLLHLENRSDHHVLLVVVEVVHHLFCLLQELFQSVWQRMINSALNEMTLVWKVKNLKRPWGSHGAKNLQARGQGWQQASPSFDPFAYPSWFCHQTLLGGSPRKHLKYGFLPHPDIWHYLKESHYFRNYTWWKIALCHLLGPSTAWISGKTSSRSSLSRLWSMNIEQWTLQWFSPDVLNWVVRPVPDWKWSKNQSMTTDGMKDHHLRLSLCLLCAPIFRSPLASLVIESGVLPVQKNAFQPFERLNYLLYTWPPSVNQDSSVMIRFLKKFLCLDFFINNNFSRSLHWCVPGTDLPTKSESPDLVASSQLLVPPQLECMEVEFFLGNFDEAWARDREGVSPRRRANFVGLSCTLNIKVSPDLIHHIIVANMLCTFSCWGSAFSEILDWATGSPLCQQPVQRPPWCRWGSVDSSPSVSRPPVIDVHTKED